MTVVRSMVAELNVPKTTQVCVQRKMIALMEPIIAVKNNLKIAMEIKKDSELVPLLQVFLFFTSITQNNILLAWPH